MTFSLSCRRHSNLMLEVKMWGGGMAKLEFSLVKDSLSSEMIEREADRRMVFYYLMLMLQQVVIFVRKLVSFYILCSRYDL